MTKSDELRAEERFLWRLENLRGSIKFADSAIKQLIYINGGAAAVLLTFFKQESSGASIPHAVYWFAVGVGCAFMCGFFAYFAQRNAALYFLSRKEKIQTNVAAAFSFLSGACFIIGLVIAATSLPSVATKHGAMENGGNGKNAIVKPAKLHP